MGRRGLLWRRVARFARVDTRSTSLRLTAPRVVHWSRYCSRRLWAPDPRVDRGAFADSLSELLVRRRYDLLLPGSDAALLAISEDRDRLSQLVTIGLPEQEAVLRCLSKIATFEGSEATELAAPPTKVCRTVDEAREAVTEIGFPLLVKPRMSARPRGIGLRQRSSRRVSSESELAATIEDFGMPILVQHCLRGPVHSLGGVITDQGLVAAAHSRYVRTWPPDAGNVSCSVSLPLPAQLREATATLLDRLGWRGIFELELMEKPDGSLGVIDLNPRVYGSLELAVHAGASLPVDLVRFAVGRPGRLGDPRCTSGCLVPVGGRRRPIRVAPAQVRRDEGRRASAQASPGYRTCSLPAVRPGPLVRAGDLGSPGQTSKPTAESTTAARCRAQRLRPRVSRPVPSTRLPPGVSRPVPSTRLRPRIPAPGAEHQTPTADSAA